MARLLFPAGKKGIACGNSPLGYDLEWENVVLERKRYSFKFCQVEDYERTVYEMDASGARGNYNHNCTALVLRSPKNMRKFVKVHFCFRIWPGYIPYPLNTAGEKKRRELEERFQGAYTCVDFFGW